jgi:hypothetical protein
MISAIARLIGQREDIAESNSHGCTAARSHKKKTRWLGCYWKRFMQADIMDDGKRVPMPRVCNTAGQHENQKGEQKLKLWGQKQKINDHSWTSSRKQKRAVCKKKPRHIIQKQKTTAK